MSADTYVVLGSKKHCIYDLSCENLYSISNNVKDLIFKLLQKENAIKSLDRKNKTIAEHLIEIGLLLPSAKKEPIPDIKNLTKQYSIDFVWIETTRKCNLKCDFCYEKSTPNCIEKITMEDFDHVIDELKSIGVKKIQFIGGEPLLFPKDLRDMINKCLNDFSVIEVFTNGTHLSEEWCNFFKINNIHVALSIQSYLPEEHDRVTHVDGSHKKTVRAIQLLKQYDIPYRLATIKTKTCKIGRKPPNSIYQLTPKPAILTGRADISQYDFATFAQKAITKDSKKYPIRKNDVIKFVSGHRCFLNKLYISSNLDIFPCVMERRFKHGNLKTKKLLEIIDDNIRKLSNDHIAVCKDCEYRYTCYDCRPNSNNAGKYDKPWFCSYDPYTGEWQDLKIMFKNLRTIRKHSSTRS